MDKKKTTVKYDVLYTYYTSCMCIKDIFVLVNKTAIQKALI